FYGYSFWAPLVIQSLTKSSDLGVGLILGAISAVTIGFMVFNSAHSDRTRERPLHVAIPLLISGAGFFGCALFRQPIWALFSLLAACAIVAALLALRLRRVSALQTSSS